VSHEAPAGDRSGRVRSSWRSRLRARLGLAPNPHAAAIVALRRDDRPLRAAYARVAHATVADLRDRLAEPGDHGRKAWPTFEAYRDMVMRSQRHSRASDRRLLWKREGGLVECGWRLAGLDFAEVVTREQDGLIREVEFVLEQGTSGIMVRIDAS
jgi:hypothetical protein